MSLVLDDLFETLASVPEQHAPSSPFSRLLKRVVRAEVAQMFSDPDPEATPFGPFGSIRVSLPRQMGKISSLNLFDIDELDSVLFLLAKPRPVSARGRHRSKYRAAFTRSQSLRLRGAGV